MTAEEELLYAIFGEQPIATESGEWTTCYDCDGEIAPEDAIVWHEGRPFHLAHRPESQDDDRS